MPSQFQDTTVEELDVGNLSDEQLQDIAQNDDRVTAQEKAQAELNRRGTADAPAAETAPLSAQDEKERAQDRPEAPVKDSQGYESGALSQDLGAGQVQHDMDLATGSGVFPGDGNPPAATHTVEAVTQVPAAGPPEGAPAPQAPAEEGT